MTYKDQPSKESGFPLYDLASILLGLQTEYFLWTAKAWQQHCLHRRSVPSWMLLSGAFHKADNYCKNRANPREYKRSDWDRPEWWIRKLIIWRIILWICQQIRRCSVWNSYPEEGQLWISHTQLSGYFFSLSLPLFSFPVISVNVSLFLPP